jgi:hypothetical protein
MSTEGWGLYLDEAGNGRPNLTVSIKNAGTSQSAEIWPTATGGSASTSDLVTDSLGRLVGFIEEGSYDLTVESVTYRVQATAGETVVSNTGRVSALEQHLADPTAAHAAEAISVTPAGPITETNVQAALAEIAGEVVGTGYAGAWTPATDVLTNEIRSAPDGSLIVSNLTRTTRASYDATEETFWETVGVDVSDIETDLDALTSTVGAGYLPGVEQSGDLAAPAANAFVLYAKDVGGKTALFVRFNTGAVQQIAIEP